MINLEFDTAYQYTKIEKLHLRSLRRKYGHRYQLGYGVNKNKVWYDGETNTRKIKHEISKRLLAKARFRCAYCEKSLVRSEKAIDHFIPNASYPAYSFHPLNLIPSCGYCNETLKNQYDTIFASHNKYHLITFRIVHPIVHNVVNHLSYQAPDDIYLDPDNCSVEGKESVRLFKLASYEMSIERAHQKTLSEKFPLTDPELLQLVAETATYRPKQG